jgi:hypothetical protein
MPTPFFLVLMLLIMPSRARPGLLVQLRKCEETVKKQPGQSLCSRKEEEGSAWVVPVLAERARQINRMLRKPVLVQARTLGLTQATPFLGGRASSAILLYDARTLGLIQAAPWEREPSELGRIIK